MFDYHRYMISDIESNKVTVTNLNKNGLTLLKGDKRDFISRLRVANKSPFGVTTGPSGNICVCYSDARVLQSTTCRRL